MDELVVVLMTSYNHEKYISETIESVLNQTYKNIKLVIVDDCSKDNSRDIILGYAEKYPDRVFYIFNEINMHVNRSMNRGLEYIKDKFSPAYLATLASDDTYELDKIELQMKFIKEYEFFDGVSTSGSYMDEQSNITGKIKLNKLFDKDLNSVDDSLKYAGHVYENIVLDAPYLQSMLFRFDCAYKLKFNIDSNADDFLFIIRFLNENYKLGYINKPLWKYRLHEQNTHKNYDYMFLIIDAIERYIPQRYKKQAMFKQLFLYAIYQFFYHKNRTQGIRYFIFAMTYINTSSIKYFSEKFFKGIKWAWKNR